nr:hypothetical protein [Palleronia abyssalis]
MPRQRSTVASKSLGDLGRSGSDIRRLLIIGAMSVLGLGTHARRLQSR